jgi:GAF domain-containing protein
MSVSCQKQKSKSSERPMRQPKDWVIWRYTTSLQLSRAGAHQMAKRGQAVRRSPTRSKAPTKRQRVPADADLKKQIATLKRELAEALERQTATSEVLQVIGSTPGDLEPVFQSLLENATRVCGAKFGTMHLLEEDTATRVALYNVPLAYADALETRTFRPHPEGGLGQVIRTKQVAQIADLRTNPAYLEGSPAIAALSDVGGARTLVVVPMLRDGKVIGTIGVYRQEVRPFTDKQVELLSNFAKQAVIAIENTRLFNETQEALERQTATADILKVIASSPSDVHPVFEAIAESATRLFGGYQAVVTRRDSEHLHLAAIAGSKEGRDALRRRYPMPLSFPSLHAKAALNGTVESCADIETDPNVTSEFKEIGRARGFRSVLAVPMLREGIAIGTIGVARPEPGEFSIHQIELLKTFADQAVIAIENTRLFNETKEALERQTATSEVLQVIASSPSDTQPVFDAIARRANTLIGGFSSTVFRFINGMAYLEAFTPTTPAADEVLKTTFPSPVADFAPFRMVHAGEVTQIPDTEASTYELQNISRARGYRSMLYAPLMSDGMSIGFIAVTRVQPGTFPDHHVQLLRTFADQAVIAIENARLFEEVQAKTRDLTESLQQQTATSEVLKVISSSPGELEPVFKSMLENAVSICDAKFGNLFLIDGDSAHWEAGVGTPPKLAQYFTHSRSFRPTPGSHLDRVMRTKKASHSADDAAEAVVGRLRADGQG